MLGLLRQAGLSLVSDHSQATAGVCTPPLDVLLVNTCCFIAAAREESAEALEEAIARKRKGEAKVLICAGCWPAAGLAGLRARFPEVDAFMGPGEVPEVVSVVEGALRGTGGEWRIASPPTYLYDDTAPRVRATRPWTAYIKIAEGCDHRCTFCVIPRLRGRFRSRSLDSVVREARRLVEEGVMEVNLVAQDTTAYQDDGHDIADLLAALAKVEACPERLPGQGSRRGLRWIRLLYGFPTRVTEKLIEVMAQEPSVCQYLDLPFQHADREVLRRMGRPGDCEQYLALITRLRAAMPDIALRSTFLVGFPGEGEAEFRRLLEFLEAAQLDRAGAFCYSREAGTPAADMPGQVPPEVAQERYHQVMSLQQRVCLARNQRWVGRELEVLIEEPAEGPALSDSSAEVPRPLAGMAVCGADLATLAEAEAEGPGAWVGRSFRDAPEIDGTVVVRAGRRVTPGVFAKVTVTDALEYDLVGTLRAKTAAGRAQALRSATAARDKRP
jgi:ribosomal protein S12 methylthiotransferase